MPEKACKNCRRIVKGNICPVCKSSNLTTNWRGILVVLDSNSEIAKEAGITSPGRYVIRTK
jgi:DNA-directed RNA polymerase subunit E"